MGESQSVEAAEIMANFSSGSTGIATKDQNILVDNVPEPSTSDIEGHVTGEELFDSKRTLLSWDLNDWVEYIFQTPFLLGVVIGTLVAVILLVIGFCLVCFICRTNWPKVMREAGFHQQISLKRLKGAEYYKVNERNREYNYGWEYKHATVKPVNSINNMPKVKRYDYTIERPAPPPPPPLPPPIEEDQIVATENFGPEYGDEDHSTLSTRESDIIDRRDKKNFNKKLSTTKRPASCAMITNEAFFQIRRPESWDVSSWPREQINKEQTFP